jgi:hypothetical protein
MAEFRYTVGGQLASLVIEESNPRRMVFEAERAILTAIQAKGAQIDDTEKRYLQSKIAVALARDLLSKQFVDLGAIQVRKRGDSSGDEGSADEGDVYSLINIADETSVKRRYRPDQAVGAIIADIRQLYGLGMDDDVILTQLVNGERREISVNTLVRDLASRQIHWEVRKFA